MELRVILTEKAVLLLMEDWMEDWTDDLISEVQPAKAIERTSERTRVTVFLMF